MPDIINANAIAAIITLAIINNRIIAYFVAPIFEHKKWDRKWMLYVSAVTGFLVGLTTNLMLFREGLFIFPIMDKLALALLVGGGASLIHDALDRKVDDGRVNEQDGE